MSDRDSIAPLTDPVMTAEDRSISVPPGFIPVTRYVNINRIIFVCRDRMAVGDVEKAYRRRLQLGDHQPYPCPRGHWNEETFVIEDGRHDYVAALMLGVEFLLVTWLKEEN